MIFCTIFYADDTELHSSWPPARLDNMCDRLSFCMDNIKGWTIKNKLKLNENKTKAMVLGKPQYCLEFREIPLILQAVGFPLHLRWRALVSPLTLSGPWNSRSTLCRACYFRIRQISRIRKFLNQESVLKLVSCFVLSRLNYCNSLLADLPTENINKLQNFQNCAVRLVLGMRKRELITPALKNLHWLPISQRIHYKLWLLCCKSFNFLLPSYFSDFLSPYTVSCILRSASDITKLSVPRYRLELYGKRAFPDLHLLSGTHCLLFSVKPALQTLFRSF